MHQVPQRLSNTQLEILKVFRHSLDEPDLKRLRKTLAAFFAEMLMDEADKVWEEEGWDEAKVEQLLHTKLRKKKE